MLFRIECKCFERTLLPESMVHNPWYTIAVFLPFLWWYGSQNDSWGSSKGAHLRKTPRANNILLLYHRYTEHIWPANSHSLPISLLNNHRFYVNFLSIDLSGPKWVSSMGSWIKTSWIMSGPYGSCLFNISFYLVFLVPHAYLILHE